MAPLDTPDAVVRAAAFAHCDLIREWVTRIILGDVEGLMVSPGENPINFCAYIAAMMMSSVIGAISVETDRAPIDVWQVVSVQLLDESKRP
jgi:hypothetical protein